MKKKLISWIVPAYNVENSIIECLTSLVSVGLHDDLYEIIVINDGSSDNTLIKIMEFASKHPTVKVFTQCNKGLSITRNRGIDLAKGEYIQFVDSDDVIYYEDYDNCLKYAVEKNLDILTFGYEKNGFKVDETINNTTHTNCEKLVFSDVMDGSTLWENYSFVTMVWSYIIKRDLVVDNNLRFEPGVIL